MDFPFKMLKLSPDSIRILSILREMTPQENDFAEARPFSIAEIKTHMSGIELSLSQIRAILGSQRQDDLLRQVGDGYVLTEAGKDCRVD